ncbi:MAG TPA: AraC family transcriptional regulator [Bacillota bacterium]|nr:AraC family transcriptional regulator [Bacillota bacterium]
MDWLERMNGAIDYIEEHITEEIDFEKVAQVAWCSMYYFQRLFSFITDIPLSEYVRRRRLTLAAFDLQNSDLRIIDLAMKYGYDSNESFSRAFQKLHGLTPSTARTEGVRLIAYPRISFHISIKGDMEMNYKIETKEAFSVFGVEKIISNVDGENFKAIPKFWKESCENGIVDKIYIASGCNWDEHSTGLMPVNAVMCYRDTGKNTFPYMLCAFTPKEGVVAEYTVLEVPSLLWAVFTTEKYNKVDTTKPIQNLWKRIFAEWFPTSGYEHANGPEFEMYYLAEDGMEYCEVWIPVVKKD